MRFAAIAWAIALPSMYALLIWLKTEGGLPNVNWLFVAFCPPGYAGSILGGMWLCERTALARARNDEKADAEPSTPPVRVGT
jgi:hypothetical protein